MAKSKKAPLWLAVSNKYRQSILITILFFAFATRIYRLHIPERYIFDEVYHAVTAKLIAKNDPWAFEWWNPPPEKDTAVDWLHPPLAKYTQALSIKIFGETSFGWRLSSALFGVGVIYLVYKLADELFDNAFLSLLAAYLASLDGLLLTQSRIAMNDIHVTFFILLTLIFYWKYRKSVELGIQKTSKKKLFLQPKYLLLITGASAGLALASKWSGAFALLSVGLFEAVLVLKTSFQELINKKKLKKISTPFFQKVGLMLAALVLLPAVIYLASYGQMFLQGKNLSHFRELHRQIWSYQTSLEATHTYQSRPWQWFFNLRPVWYHVDYIDNETIANIYAFGNPALMWIGVVTIFMSLGVLWLGLVKNKGFYLLLFSYLMLWLPWVLSPRIMFFYHYTPAVALLSIIVAWWLSVFLELSLDTKSNQRWIGYSLVGLIILATTIVFAVWYPQWTALPVSKDFADQIYFSVNSWR